MKGKFLSFTIAVMLLLAGCAPHRVELEPLQVAPIQITLDLNINLPEQIENASTELIPVRGKTAPDFTLMDQNRKPVTLSNFRGKWVVLYFYPKDSTPGCAIEAVEFTKLLDKFHAINAEVFGISEDSPESHCGFIDQYKLELILLSDQNHQVMQQYGAWVTSMVGGWEYGRAIRTSMIVDPQGHIRHYWPEVIALGHGQRVFNKLAEVQGINPATITPVSSNTGF